MKDGKLFGKINIIDLLVVLLVVAAAVFLALRLSNRNSSPSSPVPSVSRIRYVVKVSRVDPELYEAAKARIDDGETQLVAGEQLIDGNIVAIRAVQQHSTLTTDDGRFVEAEDPIYLNVYITVEAAVTNPVTNLVVTQETRVGSANTVKTLGVQFNGTVISLEKIN